MSACGVSCPAYAELWRVGSTLILENDATGTSCYNITNAAGLGDILAPAKTSSEWTDFYNNAPSGVSFSSVTHDPDAGHPHGGGGGEPCSGKDCL